MTENSPGRIETVEAFSRGNPQGALGILVEVEDLVVARAVGLFGAMLEMGERLGFEIEPVEAVLGADPQRSCTVDVQAGDPLVAEAMGVADLGPKRVEGLPIRMETKQAPIGTQPQVAVLVFDDIVDPSRGLGLENGEDISIEAIEAVAGTKPQKALAILKDRKNIHLRQAIAIGQVSKTWLVVRRGRAAMQGSDQRDEQKAMSENPARQSTTFGGRVPEGRWRGMSGGRHI